jgi:hypothetical protein
MDSWVSDGCVEVPFLQFEGQSALDAWTYSERIRAVGWSRYDAFLSQEPELFLCRLRELMNDFPTWQRRARTGRPAADERIVLAGLVLRQYLRATFRQVESYLRIVQEFMGFGWTYDATTLSLKNRQPRFTHLFQRFHAWILRRHGRRKCIIATDATGYAGRKQVWSQTDYGLRATGDFVKSHAAVMVPQMLYVSSLQTAPNLHDSQAFAAVWESIPGHIKPTRSLADSAYAGKACLRAAKQGGAVPMHAIKKNAKWHHQPGSDYEKMVRFQRTFPTRARTLLGQRSLVESTFQQTKNRFGDRLACRSQTGRINEIQTKQIAHNIRTIIGRETTLGS